MMISAFVALLLLSGSDAQPTAATLTLEEAIARGLANSHRLAELQARKEGAEAAEAGRAAASLPTVALAGGYTRTNHVDEFGIAFPGQPTRVIYPDIPDNYRARIDLNWPVYSGGLTHNSKLLAGEAAEAAKPGRNARSARSRQSAPASRTASSSRIVKIARMPHGSRRAKPATGQPTRSRRSIAAIRR